jgi:hypothetical protein
VYYSNFNPKLVNMAPNIYLYRVMIFLHHFCVHHFCLPNNLMMGGGRVDGPLVTLFLDALVHFGFVSNKQTCIIHIFSLPISNETDKVYMVRTLVFGFASKRGDAIITKFVFLYIE